MNTTIVVYGSTTGKCEAIAEKIALKLGCEAINVQDLTTEVIDSNQNLILGTSTWGVGELQDDWYDGLQVLQGANLADKTIALFGCGDCDAPTDFKIVPKIFARFDINSYLCIVHSRQPLKLKLSGVFLYSPHAPQSRMEDEAKDDIHSVSDYVHADRLAGL